MSAPVHLLEAGVITEQRYLGMAEAPPVLAHELATLARPAKRVRIPFLPRDRYLTAARESCRTLADAVTASLRDGARPVILGGECTIVAGSLPGALAVEPDLVLVYFDAHGDFNTLATTPSHFVGGMCLAHVCGKKLAPLLWPKDPSASGRGTTRAWSGRSRCSASRPSTTGTTRGSARSRRITSRSSARATSIRARPGTSPARRCDRSHSIASALTRPGSSRSSAAGRSRSTSDIDVVDPSEIPAVNFPVPGGPSVRALCDVLAAVSAVATVRGVEICAYDPRKDPGSLGLPARIARMAVAALGRVPAPV